MGAEIADLNGPTVERVVSVSDTECLLLWFLEGALENAELCCASTCLFRRLVGFLN